MHFRLEVPLFIALMITWVSCQSCGNVQLSGNTGIFTTPGYPGKYDHKADCWWTITAPKGHFIHVTFKKFDIVNPFWTCSDDYVTVTYDETKSDDKFCNDHPPPEVIKSTTNMLKFHLESDRFMANGVGFEAKYDVVDKFGNKLAGDDEDEDDWDDDTTTTTTTTTLATTTTLPTTTTESTTTTTTAAPATTTSTVASTTTTSSMAPATTSTTTAAPATTTTSTLISKITSISTKTEKTTPGAAGNDDGISGDPGAMSGVLIGLIIGVVLIVFGVILFVAFVRYRRNKNKRIDLSVIEVNDDKELITNDKVYKKQGKKIVRVPEAETFPL